jgi:hypothetical protein
MTELLENSDNTNADTGVSESPSNEATISLAAVQALADALQKIESYTPTVWVDNESPDIDAAHLNKAEQAIMRVTTAMNSAVDVIKDLQSQVNTTNNNLSNIGTVTTASGIYTTAEWAVGTNTAVLTLPSDGNYILLMTYELQNPTDETCSMYAQMQITANRAILPFGKTNFVSFYHRGITQGYDSRIAYEGVCVAINAKKGDTIIPYVHTDKSNVAFNVNIIAMRV